MPGKRQRVDGKGQQRQPVTSEAPKDTIEGEISSVTILKSNSLPKVKGLVGNVCVNTLFDSGSSISLVSEKTVLKCNLPTHTLDKVSVQTASCDKMLLSTSVSLPIKIGSLEVVHKAFVCKRLVSPIILGTDFMCQYDIDINFQAKVIKAKGHGVIWPEHVTDPPLSCTVHTHESFWENSYNVAAIIPDNDEAEECAIPLFHKNPTYSLPPCAVECQEVVNEYRDLFTSIPGKTNTVEHHIPTEGASPIRVPPRRIPNHYRQEVERQINEMLEQGIIVESTSPWLAPCVYVPKKNGELRICVDYRELNKRTKKNSYPLPLPDEVQDRVGQAQVFSKLDCRKGFWQVPVSQADRHKTAFSPGPGMGLYEFCRLPFGLSGSPGTFQLLMDQVLRGLDFVIVYVDDILIYSPNMSTHIDHLREVFNCLKRHGITLHAQKCQVGFDQVTYLGHTFSKNGMSADPAKTQVIEQWPPPTNVTEVRRFLGLASYYRRYIKGFATIAEPLHKLTNKGVSFNWTTTCQSAFDNLKQHLLSPPILKPPNFSLEFTLCTDASDTGLGAVLQQGTQVVAYASRTLNPAERNYSVIEKECLALVYAVKQFRHYLLGKHFTILTDHNPLVWLSAQKMQGRLSRWALALQEYEYTIKYRKGSQNSNADALSRLQSDQLQCGVTEVSSGYSSEHIRELQLQDPVLKIVSNYLSRGSKPTQKDQQRYPAQLKRWLQVWHQLVMKEGVLYRRMDAPGYDQCKEVLVVPSSLKSFYMQQCHDIPSAGHQSFQKTLDRLRSQTYWVGMATDTRMYCETCDNCHCSKDPLPPHLPMINTPIGKPWEMVAVDVLKLPLSTKGNQYLLVIQDYFTKWLEAIPLKDQTADTIVAALIRVFSAYGIPRYLHSDQGANFESTMLQKTCEAFGIHKTHTTAYHPQGDGLVERANRSILQMLRAYSKNGDWEKWLPLLLYAYRTSRHSSTKLTPFALMFGRDTRDLHLPASTSEAYDSMTYQGQLHMRLAEMYDIVETNLAQAGVRQKKGYDDNAKVRSSFKVGDAVWLSVPPSTRNKLDAKWEGGWTVKELLPNVSSVRIQHEDGRTKVTHMNRIRYHLIRKSHGSEVEPSGTWEEPIFQHEILEPDPTVAVDDLELRNQAQHVRRSQRNR